MTGAVKFSVGSSMVCFEIEVILRLAPFFDFNMQFCRPCMQLDVSLSSFISHPGTDDNPRLRSPIHSLGRLDETQKRSQSCQLCRLVFAAFQSGPLKSILNLTDLRRITIFAKWVNALGSSREQRLQSSTLAILL
jgi:hypothetical protein